MSSSRLVYRNGKWSKGRAAPELLEKDLRELPGDFVTKDTGDPDKIHQLDDPHIRRVLAKDQTKAILAKDSPPEDLNELLGRAPVGEIVPLNQPMIDVERFFVLRGVVKGQLRELDKRERLAPDLEELHWLYFEDNNVNKYVVRKGTPPAPSELPSHMCRFNVVVDLFNPPQSVIDKLKAIGSVQAKFLDKLLKSQKQKSFIEVVHG